MKLKQRKVIKQSAQESMEAVIDLVRNFETKLRPPSGVKILTNCPYIRTLSWI